MKDQWFAMIIYPSISVKVRSEGDSEIRNLIEAIKPTKSFIEIRDENQAYAEPNSKPIEVDLDSCQNF